MEIEPAMATPGSIQLRFKRKGLELSRERWDVTLEAGLKDELRHVFQTYGGWEVDAIMKKNGEPAGTPGPSTSAHIAASKEGDESARGHETARPNAPSSSENAGAQEGTGNSAPDLVLPSAEAPVDSSRHWEGLHFRDLGKVRERWSSTGILQSLSFLGTGVGGLNWVP